MRIHGEYAHCTTPNLVCTYVYNVVRGHRAALSKGKRGGGGGGGGGECAAKKQRDRG